MEMLPNLRRLSKRTVLIFYFICAMFTVCVFYTFYSDSSSENSIRKTIATKLFNSKGDKLLVEDSDDPNPSTVHDTIVLPEATFRSNSSIVHDSNTNHQSVHRSIASASTSNLNQRTASTHTKYVYVQSLTSSSVGTSMKSTNVLPKRTSTTTLPPDTCQTFGMKNSKLILLWTPFFDYWEYFSEKKLSECRRCRNCRITHDRSKLLESDAVIFHCRDMSMSDMPSARNPNQRWIFYCLESPPYSDFPGMDHMVDMFNWTMSYRRDSDIVTQYGGIKKIHPSRKLDILSLQASFNNKTKSVVWMSSHCPTHGGRDDFVEELRKWIDVDIYGSCGDLTCPPDGTSRCLRDFASKYRFFLAFENTICKDYVTEKFFRNLGYNMIPVVYGGAPYAKIAPPGSFIDALSFKSPKHLAYFMAGIGRDFKIWSSYFKWRQDYVVDMRERRECDLCSLLHKKNIEAFSYKDFKKWWVKDANCRTWKPKR